MRYGRHLFFLSSGIDAWYFRLVCRWWAVELPVFITEMTPFTGKERDLHVLKRLCPNINKITLSTSFVDGNIYPIEARPGHAFARVNHVYEICLFASTLTYLDLGPCYNIRGNALTYTSELRTLKLGRNTRIVNTDIAHLTKLEVLDVGDNQNISDTGIYMMQSLRKIKTSSSGRITCSGLYPLSKLEVVSPSNRYGISVALDTSVIRASKNLKEYTIANDSVDVAFLSGCRKLRKLAISSFTQNLDIGLYFLTNLTKLTISNCSNITDNSFINLTALQSLSIFHSSGFGDYSIHKLTALQWLEIEHNNSISDDSISCLINLTYLSISENTRITDESVANLPLLDQLDLDFPALCNISPATANKINHK